MTDGGQRRTYGHVKRALLLALLACLLCIPVVSSLASPSRSGGASRPAVARAARQQRLADLTVTVATAELKSPTVLSGTATIRNTGTLKARVTTAGVDWKHPGGSAVQIGTFKVPTLAPGKKDKVNYHLDVPKGASGTYEVRVCADVLSQISELSKKNNCHAAATVKVAEEKVVTTETTSTSTSSEVSTTTVTTSTGTGHGLSPTPNTFIDSGPSGTVGVSTATFTFHGSEASNTFECNLDTTTWATCTSPKEYAGLSNGAHTFEVRAVNGGSTVDPTPAQATWTVDTSTPVVTLSSPANGTDTNHNTPTFTGSAGTATGDLPTITVKVYSGSSAAGTPLQTLTTTAAAGSWSVKASGALLDGTYTAQASQSSESGHSGLSTAGTFTVDTVAPLVTLTAPANGATLYNDKPTLSGAAGIATGDSMAVTVKVYSGSSASGTPVETLPVTALGSAWTAISTSTLSEGTYTAEAEQSDGAANLGKSAPSTFKVTTTPPITTITSAPSGRIPIGEVSISFNANEPGSTFQCSLDGWSYASCTSPYVIKTPPAGPHSFLVKATNESGFTTTTAASASWSSVEPVHDLCGTISSNATVGPDYAAVYLVTCTVEVPVGATLTVQPGAVIKAEKGSECTAKDLGNFAPCAVFVEGTLDAIGTASEPITFTSINDNSIGGITGSGKPAAGDWGGIYAGTPGSVDVEHANVSYAFDGVQTYSTGATVLKRLVLILAIRRSDRRWHIAHA